MKTTWSLQIIKSIEEKPQVQQGLFFSPITGIQKSFGDSKQKEN